MPAITHVVLSTCIQWPALSTSDRLYAEALASRGLRAEAVPWNGTFSPFQAADLVVLRANWDYHQQPAAFAEWLAKLEASGTPIFNAPALVRWNLDKRYLFDLERRGVPIPRSAVVEGSASSLKQLFEDFGWERAVIKPVIGASGHGVRLVARRELPSYLARPPQALADRQLLVQEFMPEVQSEGELSCIFFGGAISHAVCKRPRSGEFRVNSQYQGGFELAHPENRVLDQARSALDAIPALGTGAANELPLYARVDGVVRQGQFILMELELNEPGLYLTLDPPAADRFAAATIRRLRG